MKIGVLGTGMVGEEIASKLAALGHEVMMGSRSRTNERARSWAVTAPGGRVGTFNEAAAFGEIVFNCTKGVSSIDALRTAGEANLEDKIIVDVANVLPPAQTGPESLGQQIQRVFPRAKVVKTLNTINCQVMVNPASVPGAHSVFISGNDASAKKQVRALLESFGWRDIIDLGDIATSKATEAYLPLWVDIWKSLGTASFNISVTR